MAWLAAAVGAVGLGGFGLWLLVRQARRRGRAGANADSAEKASAVRKRMREVKKHGVKGTLKRLAGNSF